MRTAGAPGGYQWGLGGGLGGGDRMFALRYESRQLPGRLKVAPYEVRGKGCTKDTVPKGRLNPALDLPMGKDLLLVTGDNPSVVPAGTRLLSDRPYPGLDVLGYFHALPSGLPGAKTLLGRGISHDQKNYTWPEKYSLPILDEQPLLRCGGSVEIVTNERQHKAPEQDVYAVGDAQPG
jgi:hypothetical protein